MTLRHTLLATLIACMLSPLTLLGQQAAPTTLDGWAQRTKAFGSNIPQEEVFIHMDNTCYFLGDTIYYKAYVRRSDTGAPSNVSGLLYCELYNQDGYLMERQNLKLTGGQGCGSFALLDTLYAGYYELRAYTRWQLNWGEYQHPHTRNAERWFYSRSMAREYFRDYEKLYSRVFPVYDRPTAAGEYTQDMTLRPLQRYFRKDLDHSDARITFYPEGGSLIQGARQRVAFEVNDLDGQHLQGNMTVRDQAGNIVCTATTQNRGRGVLLLPQVGTGKYTAQFQWGDRTARQTLPAAEADGCALTVEQSQDMLQLTLSPQGAAASEPLGITVMVDGRQVACRETQGGAAQVQIPLSDIPCGVAQVTVYNSQGRVYADRLAFVRHQDILQRSQLQFTGVADGYEAYSPIDIGVHNPLAAGSTISVAVRDAAFSEYINDNSTMLTEMLLCSQIRGFVEDPQYYFAQDDEERRTALDLLLMVQGWRRHSWRVMSVPGAFVLNHKPEHTQLLMGEVLKYTGVEQENTISNEIPEDTPTEEPTPETEGQQYIPTVDDQLAERNARFDADRQHYAEGNEAAERFNENEGNLKREVLVHAEFIQSDTKGRLADAVVGDVMTERKGKFSIQAPAFEGDVRLLLGASDSTRWRGGKHNWVERGEDKNDQVIMPEYYLRLSPIYPRFVKPYDYYQTQLAPSPEGSLLSVDLGDGARTLGTVTIRSKRNGMRHLDPNKPAFTIDAYTALNDVCDAGLCPGYYIGMRRFVRDVACCYIGDMNMERSYKLVPRWDGKKDDTNIPNAIRNRYNTLKYLDYVNVYTDYSPRREGDERYSQSDQPEVHVSVHLLADNCERPTWRDRRYVLYGYSVCEDFYQPDYSTRPLPSHVDYRRTLYWNPSVRLDDEGKAQLHFYNNGRHTQLILSAEGMTPAGQPLSGTSYPEDR